MIGFGWFGRFIDNMVARNLPVDDCGEPVKIEAVEEETKHLRDTLGDEVDALLSGVIYNKSDHHPSDGDKGNGSV